MESSNNFPLQILVVEDNIVEAHLIQNVIQELGLEVLSVVASGEEALEFLETKRPDLVILDVMLAGELNGVEIAERINHEFNLPFIFTTSFSDKDSIQKAKATAPYAYLVKPVTKEMLTSTIEITLKRIQVDRKLDKTRNELNSILKATHAVVRQNGFSETAEAIYHECKKMIGARAGYVALLSDDGSENEIVYLDAGDYDCSVDHELPMPIRGFRAEAYKSGNPAVDNSFNASEWKQYLPQGHVTLDNVMFVPVNIDGQPKGLIGLANKEGGFKASDIQKVKAFGELASLALYNANIRESLSSSESLFRGAFQEAGVGMALIGMDRKIKQVNYALSDMLGYKREELIGRSIEELGYWEEASARRETLNRFLDGSLKSVQPEVRLRHKRGHEVWCSETLSLVSNSTGTPTMAVFQAQNITPRKQSEIQIKKITTTLEEKVKERTYQLNVLLGLSGEMGFAPNFDELFHLMMINLEKVIEHDVAASLVKTGPDFNLYIQSDKELTTRLRQKIQDRLTKTFQLLDPLAVDVEAMQIRVLDVAEKSNAGESLDFISSVFQVPIITGDEKRIAGILLVGSAHEQFYAEEQIQLLYTVASQASEAIIRLEKRLSREQAQMISIMENLPHGIVLLDEENKIIMMNSSAVSPITDLSSARHGQILDRLNDFTIDDLVKSSDSGASVQVIRIDGPPVRVFEVICRRLESGHIPGGKILALRDITEESQVEERIKQQDRLAAVGQLAAGIAHDFNNLLTAIGGYSDMISCDPDSTPSIKENAKVVRQQVRRAATLIRQILDFSRKSISTQHPIELKAFLKENNKLLRRTINETITIDFNFEAGDFIVKADPVGIQQVITNLAINAQDAMKDGGVIDIHLGLVSFSKKQKKPFPHMKDGNWVKLTVMDTGHGIPPDKINSVFDPFYTTKPVGKGTGLGLSQALGIIESHGGFMELESIVGRGTTFIIYLPLIGEVKKETSESKSEIVRGNEEYILLVEDEKVVLNMTEKMLNQIGYQVLKACDGVEALEIYRQHSDAITLVLTDMVMPRMGGKELIAELKAINPEIKIIVWTGYPLDGSESLFQEGAIDWIMKPPDLRVLAQKIKECVG